MSNALDRIVNVRIDINRAPATVDAYEHLLIIGPGPAKAPEKPPAPIGSYTDLDAVAAAGWAISGDNADPVGVAARLAFTQAKKPAYIYIAVQQTSEAGLEGIDATVQRALGNPTGGPSAPQALPRRTTRRLPMPSRTLSGASSTPTAPAQIPLEARSSALPVSSV